jgi:Icc-related predicted phosphoesterase
VANAKPGNFQTMKILALSDEVDQRVYSEHARLNFGHVDLIVGCGDLPIYYLEFVADALEKPVLYVRGNHDTEPELKSDGERRVVADGCDLIDDCLLTFGGFSFMGMGGSVQYMPGAPQQFSERQMMLRMLRLLPRALLARGGSGRLVDIVVAHSPPAGLGDLQDPAHAGFTAFNTLIRWARPQYFLHGHVDAWLNSSGRVTEILDTEVVNVNPVHLLNVPD